MRALPLVRCFPPSLLSPLALSHPVPFSHKDVDAGFMTKDTINQPLIRILQARGVSNTNHKTGYTSKSTFVGYDDQFVRGSFFLLILLSGWETEWKRGM